VNKGENRIRFVGTNLRAVVIGTVFQVTRSV